MIALIHAVHPAIAPVEQAIRTHWPQVRHFNLIDDGLPAALEAAGTLTPAIDARITHLCAHALAAGVQGILYTCSAFGTSIEQAAAAARPCPVLKPNEAMFEAALALGQNIGMVATFAPSVPSMEAEFRAMAAAKGLSATLHSVCIPAAMAAAKAGNMAEHNRLVAQTAQALRDCDAVLLAHFSTAPALAEVQATLPCPVLTAPDAAVLALRRRVEQQ